MPTKNTRVLTMRLPNRLADAIEAEAEWLGLTRNMVLVRRLTRSFQRDPKFRDSEVDDLDVVDDRVGVA